MKEELKVVNDEFKKELFKSLKIERQYVVNQLLVDREEILLLNPLKKWIRIYPHVLKLSFHKDSEIISLIKSFGLSKYTPKIFVSYIDLFKVLDEHQEKTKYLFPYETIWGFYELYSLSVIKEKIGFDLGTDLTKIGRKINRQEKNGNLPNIIKNQIEDLKIVRDFLRKEIPDFKFPIKDNNTVNSVVKTVKYSHKIELNNLCEYLVDFNKKAELIDSSESDFKCEFYDLLELVLREKTLLNDGEEAQSNYYSVKRFKIKRVERLILS